MSLGPHKHTLSLSLSFLIGEMETTIISFRGWGEVLNLCSGAQKLQKRRDVCLSS